MAYQFEVEYIGAQLHRIDRIISRYVIGDLARDHVHHIVGAVLGKRKPLHIPSLDIQDEA
jgi:hypothetical protein